MSAQRVCQRHADPAAPGQGQRSADPSVRHHPAAGAGSRPRVLTPRVKAADEWRPESTVSVEVSEAKGRSMTYTLAVVDEGLLG